MSTTTKTETATSGSTTRPARRPQPASATRTELHGAELRAAGLPGAELLDKRPASELTRLIFMALLGCAACIALVGVVGQANDAGTGPDDPAPAVIVELAD